VNSDTGGNPIPVNLALVPAGLAEGHDGEGVWREVREGVSLSHRLRHSQGATGAESAHSPRRSARYSSSAAW
jgi:hypothetical protein